MTSDDQGTAADAVPDDPASAVPAAPVPDVVPSTSASSPAAPSTPVPSQAVPSTPVPSAAAPSTAAPVRPAQRSLVVSWVIGLLVVAVAAGLLGGLAALLAGVTAGGDWGGLVAVLAGFMVAAGAAGTGWLVLVLLTVQRRVPAGRRVRVTAISVGAVALTLALGYALSQVSGIGSGASALVVGALAVVAALLPPELVAREERRAAPAVRAARRPSAGVVGGAAPHPAESPAEDPDGPVEGVTGSATD